MSEVQSAQNVIDNINYVRDINNLPSYAELARAIEVKPSTLSSVLKSPMSQSAAKTTLCESVGATVRQLEEERFEDLGIGLIKTRTFQTPISNITTPYETASDKRPILNTPDKEIFQQLTEYEIDDPELIDLKKELGKKLHIQFNYDYTLAEEELAGGRKQEALNHLCAAWWGLEEDDLEAISKWHLQFFLDLSRELGCFRNIEKLVTMLSSQQFADKKLLSVLAGLLESGYLQYSNPEYLKNAKQCYRALAKLGD